MPYLGLGADISLVGYVLKTPPVGFLDVPEQIILAWMVNLDKPKGMLNINEEVGNSTQVFSPRPAKKLIIRNYTGIGTHDKE